MLATAIRSLAALDHVFVFEGPVEGNPPIGPESELPTFKEAGKWMTYFSGEWETDAAKRTAMVERAQAFPRGIGEPLWGLWLDGDELLLWGEMLHDWLWRVSQQGDEENP